MNRTKNGYARLADLAKVLGMTTGELSRYAVPLSQEELRRLIVPAAPTAGEAGTVGGRLTVEAAAIAVGMTRQGIYHAIKMGLLKAEKVGGRVLIWPEELKAYRTEAKERKKAMGIKAAITKLQKKLGRLGEGARVM